MRRAVPLALLVAVSLAGCAAAAPSPVAPVAPVAAADPLVSLFPSAAPPIRPEAGAVALRFGGRVGTVALQPVSFVPSPGRSAYGAGMTRWCGVALRQGGRASQGVVTIGAGPLETLMCDRLLAAGVVPADGAAARIGLIYEASTQRDQLRQPVVLRRDPASRMWALDEAALTRLDRERTPVRTVRDIRRALARR